MTPKFRIAFIYVSSARKTLNLLEIAQQLEISIVLVATYHLHRQSAENILSMLVTFWLLWLQISDTYRKKALTK